MGDPAPPRRRTHGGAGAGALALVKPLPPKAVAGRPGFTRAKRPRLQSPPADRWAAIQDHALRAKPLARRYITHSKFKRARFLHSRSAVLDPIPQSCHRAGHGVRRYSWEAVVRWRALGGQRCARKRTCGANHSGNARGLADAVVRGHREAGTRSFQQFRDQNHGSERLEQREIAYLGAETGRLKG